MAPGSELTFDVHTLNVNRATGAPCAPSTAEPRLFRAFIDVIADAVTVVSTRNVLIVVPPAPPGGGRN